MPASISSCCTRSRSTSVQSRSTCCSQDSAGCCAATALLRFAAAYKFLGAAVAGLARTLVSDYPRLRKRLGLSHYDEAAMLRKLAAAGFSGERMPSNIGHNQARMTFLARPAEAAI